MSKFRIERHCTNNSKGEYCLRVASTDLHEKLEGYSSSVLLGQDAINFLTEQVLSGNVFQCELEYNEFDEEFYRQWEENE